MSLTGAWVSDGCGECRHMVRLLDSLPPPSSDRCPARLLMDCPARGPSCYGGLHRSGLVQSAFALAESLGWGGELQPPSCSSPCSPARTEAEPVHRCGHAWDHAGTRAVVAPGVVCSAGSGCSVPLAEAAPGWKPLKLLVSREGKPCAMASVCPGAWGTRLTASLQRACADWPAGRGRLMALARFGLSGAEAQSHAGVRICVGVGWATSHQTAATTLVNTWHPLPEQGWFWLDCSGVQAFV